MTSCLSWNSDKFPQADSYSSQSARQQWLASIQESSSTPIEVVFGPAGQIMALSGKFTTGKITKQAIQKWLTNLGPYLGFPPGSTTVLVDTQPFLEST